MNQNIESEGFGTTLILYNLGSMIIAILSFPVLVCYLVLSTFLTAFCFGKIHIWCSKKSTELKEGLFWSQPLITYMESYAVLSMCTIINFRFVSFSFTLHLLDGLVRRRQHLFGSADDHSAFDLAVFTRCGCLHHDVPLGQPRRGKDKAKVRRSVRKPEFEVRQGCDLDTTDLPTEKTSASVHRYLPSQPDFPVHYNDADNYFPDYHRWND